MTRLRAAAAVTVALACGAVLPGAAATAAAPSPVTVQADNFRFCSGGAAGCLPTDTGFTTTVPVGSAVRWVYTDTACDAVAPCPGHNVVFSGGGGSTRLVKADGATIFTEVFTRPGRYSYFCSAHQSFGMTGTVVVTSTAHEPAHPRSTRSHQRSTRPSALAAASRRPVNATRVASARTLPMTGVPAAPLAAAALLALSAGSALLGLGRR